MDRNGDGISHPRYSVFSHLFQGRLTERSSESLWRKCLVWWNLQGWRPNKSICFSMQLIQTNPATLITQNFSPHLKFMLMMSNWAMYTGEVDLWATEIGNTSKITSWCLIISLPRSELVTLYCTHVCATHKLRRWRGQARRECAVGRYLLFSGLPCISFPFFSFSDEKWPDWAMARFLVLGNHLR